MHRWQIQFLHQIDCARRVTEDLNGLDSGKIVKEPTTACVHQNQHSLQFKTDERAPLLVLR